MLSTGWRATAATTTGSCTCTSGTRTRRGTRPLTSATRSPAQPIPDWYTEDIRAKHWELPGAHSAQELTGYDLDQWGWSRRFPRQTLAIPDMAAVQHMFDGYDTGIRYADAAVGRIVDELDALGVLDDTAILVSTDHGEGFGELGVYADHQAADEATCHIPAVLRWPGLAPRVVDGLLYHLDIGATVVDLAGIDVPTDHWDGRSVGAELRAGATTVGRDHVVVSQGAWSCQRSVRWDDHLYAATRHDAFHALAGRDAVRRRGRPPRAGRSRRATGPIWSLPAVTCSHRWTSDQLARSFSAADPMDVVMAEGGPFHCRGELPAYLERLRATGRGGWADRLATRDQGAFAAV